MNFERQCHILILVIVDFTAKGNAVFIDGCSSALVLLKVFVLLSLLKSGKFSCQTFVIVGTAYFFIHSFGVYFRNASCVAGWGRGAGQGRTPPTSPSRHRVRHAPCLEDHAHALKVWTWAFISTAPMLPALSRCLCTERGQLYPGSKMVTHDSGVWPCM